MTHVMSKPQKLLLAAQVARRCGVSRLAVCYRIKTGDITPDFVAGERFQLFREDRLESLRPMFHSSKPKLTQ